MSIKAYKYRIYANKQTTDKLQWVLDRCREVYNSGLQERREAYEMGVKRHPGYYDEETRKQLTRELAVGYYEQKRELVDIKEERPEYQDVASHVLQDVILRLKRAYDNFFRRIQQGEQPGYPRFQGRHRYNSFCYPNGAGWKLETQERPKDKKGIVRVNLKLAKIGTVKLHLHRNMEGMIKTLTIKREGERALRQHGPGAPSSLLIHRKHHRSVPIVERFAKRRSTNGGTPANAGANWIGIRHQRR